jgi:hypothetical protein
MLSPLFFLPTQKVTLAAVAEAETWMGGICFEQAGRNVMIVGLKEDLVYGGARCRV